MRSLSVSTWAWTGLLFAVGWHLVGDRRAARRWRRLRNDRDLQAETWKRHGCSWLGLFAPTLDEAIIGLKRAIAPYVSIPPLPIGVWGIPVKWGVIPLSELPVNGYIRALAQGGEEGSLLAAIETEPIPHASARGPMPPQLENAMKTLASDSSRVGLSLKSDALVAASRDTKPVAKVLRSLSAEIQLELGMFHTIYYEVPEIREAIAVHIRRFASRHAADGPRAECAISLDANTMAWLSTTPGDPESTTAPAAPLDTIPTRVRMPHAIAVIMLAVVWLTSGWQDFHDRYLPGLLDRVKMETGQGRDDAFDLLYTTCASGRATLVRELIAVFSTGKEEGESPPSENYDAISQYLYDHLKAKGSDVVPTLLQQLMALVAGPHQRPGRRLAILSVLLELARDRKLGSEEAHVKENVNAFLNTRGTDDVEREYAQQILDTLNGSASPERKAEGTTGAR